MRDLFHGTIYDINKIDVLLGKGYKDFGKGFYATAVKSHAENIARRNKRIFETRQNMIRQRNATYKMKKVCAYRYNLEFDDSCLINPGELKIKVFMSPDQEWIRFILSNRESEGRNHNYDIVIGPTADENTVTIINAYKEELLMSDDSDKVLENLIKELKPENLPKQYYFGTEAAVKKLRFKNIRREIVG